MVDNKVGCTTVIIHFETAVFISYILKSFYLVRI